MWKRCEKMNSQVNNGTLPIRAWTTLRSQTSCVSFDCSAKCASVSLPGTDMINNLTGFLLQFRWHPIALMCDIENMFARALVIPVVERRRCQHTASGLPNESPPFRRSRPISEQHANMLKSMMSKVTKSPHASKVCHTH